MKYLVYLLLGLNLAYFVWYQVQPPRTPAVRQLAPLPPDVEPLVLLSERNRGDQATTGPVVDVASEPEPEPEAVSPVVDGGAEAPVVAEVLPTCRTIGPIEERTEAPRLLSRLSQQGYAATLREGKTQVPSGYQVYLPAMSAEKAGEVVSTLKAAGMNDYFVGKRNRISLGIFSSKGKARVRQQKVRRLNYDAMLDARYKTRKVYWIDIEGEERAPGVAEGWRQIVADYPQIQIQQVSCE